MLHRDTLTPPFGATRDRAKVFGVAGFRPVTFQASIAINDERSQFSGKQLMVGATEQEKGLRQLLTGAASSSPAR